MRNTCIDFKFLFHFSTSFVILIDTTHYCFVTLIDTVILVGTSYINSKLLNPKNKRITIPKVWRYSSRFPLATKEHEYYVL